MWNYCLSELSVGMCLDFILYTNVVTYITHSRLLLKCPHICAAILSKTCLLCARHSLSQFLSKLKLKIRVKWPLISCQGNYLLSHHSAFKLILTENSTQGQTVVITYLLKTTSEKCLYSYKNK